MNRLSKIPQGWAEYYEKSLNILDDINKLIPELQKTIKDRFQNQFGDIKQIDKKVQEKTTSIMNKLRECERNLVYIEQSNSSVQDTQAEKQVRENIKRNLAIQIQETAFKMRQLQKNYFGQIKKFQQVDEQFNIEQKNPIFDENDDNSNNLDDIVLAVSQQRNQEINKLVDTINELSHMFKQLSQIVVEQGTLLDRIDFNIEKTQIHVANGNEHLQKAIQHQEGGLAKKCMAGLIFLILIFIVVLVVKYTQ